MDNPIYIALSRQTALRRQMSVVANNVANMNTTGFKREMMVYQAYSEKVPFTTKMDFVIDQGTATDHKAGGLMVTNNTFDLAINGPGYFQVDDGEAIQYTRNGTFTLDGNNRLVTQQGYVVMDPQGNPIVVPGTGSGLTISEDGSIQMDDQQVGRVAVYEFDDQRALKKTRHSMFQTDQTPNPPERSRVMQGMVESSNVSGVAEMTQLIEVSRAYESVKNIIDREDKRQEAMIQKLARPMQGF
ncbi:MAG: flagellar basal-body rod protein FlgF [Thalassobaculum sp.]|uniref:flagellar basal-body rod protein FlgF n=1 Tax=Thalassobaculum sp. TaxID=2022740 RepID=UPI0032EE04B5